MYKAFFKRFFDVILSGCALLVLALPLAIITLWLHFANKGAGAFFFQERPGFHGKIFKIVKFKSMTDEKDDNGQLLPDAQRLTPAGRFVRSTSIDELPQLWNVFVGDMSLIGPRPLLPRYLPWYTEEESHRHDVRPGITGYAQVHGRNNVTWDEKLAMDVYYVRNLNFKMDFGIVFTTIKKVVMKEDVAVANIETFLDEERKAKAVAAEKKD